MSVEQNVREYLEQNGITQKYLASRTGINQSVLCVTLQGKRRMRAEELERICHVTQKTQIIFSGLTTKTEPEHKPRKTGLD